LAFEDVRDHIKNGSNFESDESSDEEHAGGFETAHKLVENETHKDNHGNEDPGSRQTGRPEASLFENEFITAPNVDT
jgi:hypothetical protein